MATKHLLVQLVWLVWLGLAGCQKSAATPAVPPPPASENPHGFLAASTPSPPPEAAAPPAAILAGPSGRATRTASGLYSEVLRGGTSTDQPTRADVVVMTLDAWDVRGQHVESYTTDEAFTLSMGMPGMIEGITLMHKGEKRRLWISQPLQGTFALAAGPIVCDVELVDIVKATASR